MASVLSHPFRLGPRGAVEVVDPDTDAGAGEALAVLVLTRPGERQISAGFGLADPTFSGFALEDVVAAVELWGPPVDVTSVELVATGPTSQAATIAFE